ncbi:MAG TPA: PAS domain-containing protein [Polyangiaceae bacterium]
MSLADRLATERRRIVESWCSRAGTEIPADIRALGPGISTVLEDILESLLSRASDPRAARQPVGRRARGLCVERSILELALLRRVVFGFLESGSTLAPEERDVILETLDGYTDDIVSNATPSHEPRHYANEWLEMAVRAGGIGAWRWDPGGGRFEVTRNDRYNQIMGIDPTGSWTSDKLYKIIHPDDVAAVRAKFEALAAGRADHYEALYRVRHRDGSIHWIQAQGRSVRDEAGDVVRLTGAVRDVTDEMILRAQRDQLVATLSHDIRNPLAAAKANAELLRRFGPRMGDQDKPLETIVSNLDRADRMIGDLLDMSRMEAGHKLELHWCDGDLAKIAFGAVRELSTVHGDRFRLDVAGDFGGRWPCEAFQRVVENLATNAEKYGDPAAPVALHLSRTGKSVVLAIHNEGAPIPPELYKGMCEPYVRGSDTHLLGSKGWGLGLTVVRGIAQALGGHIEIESREGHGTTFRFVFPAG